ncbi:MAG TPA: Xaa-Pro peptidase family protein [Methylomirabilota bacterium]|jgi:Xaa-Pro aminopeptidase|nr:Xaa-Pro peptidase family protein [Methylomirabilota bacterium]
MASEVTGVHQRDLVGQQIVDYEPRVDAARLKRERLARLQAELGRAELGAALLYDPLNIRYATGTRDSSTGYGLRFYYRYALVPRTGRAILFGGVTDSLAGDATLDVRNARTWDFFPCGRNLGEAARRWAADLKATIDELGLGRERIGIDRLDFVGFEALRAQQLRLADARVAVEKARAIKTPDELTLIRQACAVVDAAICALRDAIRPGVTENELWAVLTGTNIRLGGEHADGRLLTAGGHTNPWYQAASDRLVRDGELVAFDTDMAGPLGYFADISRTYLCGDRPPTAEQRELYAFAHRFIQESIPLFRPGMGFQEIAEKAPAFPEKYKASRYVVLAHGAGMSDEWPAIYFPDMSWSGFGNDPEVLQENMVICVEALVGEENGRESVKLEEQLIVTAHGPEVISRAPYDWRFIG